MTRNFITKYKVILFLWISLIGFGNNTFAQSAPEIPASVSFGGITVKFDRSAQNLIEEDVKNLMSNKKFWEEKMERAILYFPIVEGILMDEEVPIDFKYLAVQESSFKADVVSSSNAVGYWQFKPETARELNLRVDKEVDERKNISSSTHAAAWYLKKNNQQFNNWVSSLYSYYQGAGAVKKMVPENWSYAREVTLTGKTDRYMLRFFAHKIALEAGIERFRSNNKIVLLESEYGKGQTFDEIAKGLGINSKELENYNRWVTDGRIPSDREYLITVPVPLDQVAAVREKLSLPVQSITTSVAYAETGFPVLKKSDVQSKDKNAPVFYEINGLPGVEARPGDKPKTLAKAGKLRTPKFMRNNDMVRDMPLIPGNVYYLAKKNKKAAVPFHTARPGDTWQSVSQAYGIRLVSLLKYNRTISRNYPIQTGQVLWLAKKRPKKQPIEIIAPKQTTPVESPEIASAAVPATNTPASGTIPDKPSGRKKYTPVLVEKSESSIAKENQQFEQGVTPQPTQPVVETKPAITTPVATNTESNDRVIIITQDNAEGAFKSAEEKTKIAQTNTPATKESNPVATTPGSVYSRQQREEADKAAAAKSVRDREETIRRETELKKEIQNKREAQAKKETELKSEVTERNNGFHVVKSGETYFSIARKYGMKVNELFDLNNKESRSTLSAGEKLRVKVSPREVADVVRAPGSTSIEREAENIAIAKEIRSKGGVEFHNVEVGQTYYSISKMHGITINELLNLNNLTGTDRLKAGQQLRVRKADKANSNDTETATQSRSQGSGRQTHTVASGETLFRISQNYGTSVDEIKKLNNMSDNNVVVGQKLKIPQK